MIGSKQTIRFMPGGNNGPVYECEAILTQVEQRHGGDYYPGVKAVPGFTEVHMQFVSSGPINILPPGTPLDAKTVVQSLSMPRIDMPVQIPSPRERKRSK